MTKKTKRTANNIKHNMDKGIPAITKSLQTSHKFTDSGYSHITTHIRGELSYLAPLGSEEISAPYFKQCFFRGGGYYPPG